MIKQTKITPYLMVKNAEEAALFYATVFNGKVGAIERISSFPKMGHLKGTSEDMVVHIPIEFEDGSFLFLCDSITKDDAFVSKTVVGNNINLIVKFNSELEIKEAYDNLCVAKTKIIMPLDKAPWGALYGIVQDKYKIIWQLNYSSS